MAYEAKMRPTEVDPRAFVAAVEHPTRRQDAELLLELLEEVSGAKPAMWGPTIIGFGERHYRYASGHEGDEPLLAFSPRKANLVLYALNYAPGSDELLGRLGKHRLGKSCLYVNKLDDVDIGVLRELIELNYSYWAEKSR